MRYSALELCYNINSKHNSNKANPRFATLGQSSTRRKHLLMPHAINSWRKRSAERPAEDEIAYLGKRVEALHGYHRAIEAEKDRQIELLDKAERGELEKMHGLLSYAIASGQVSAEAQLLHGSLADFLSAKNDADRQAAKRSVHLCLEHGTLTKCDKKPDTAELDEFEFISDPEDASA